MAFSIYGSLENVIYTARHSVFVHLQTIHIYAHNILSHAPICHVTLTSTGTSRSFSSSYFAVIPSNGKLYVSLSSSDKCSNALL